MTKKEIYGRWGILHDFCGKGKILLQIFKGFDLGNLAVNGFFITFKSFNNQSFDNIWLILKCQ